MFWLMKATSVYLVCSVASVCVKHSTQCHIVLHYLMCHFGEQIGLNCGLFTEIICVNAWKLASGILWYTDTCQPVMTCHDAVGVCTYTWNNRCWCFDASHMLPVCIAFKWLIHWLEIFVWTQRSALLFYTVPQIAQKLHYRLPILILVIHCVQWHMCSDPYVILLTEELCRFYTLQYFCRS